MIGSSYKCADIAFLGAMGHTNIDRAWKIAPCGGLNECVRAGFVKKN